ncbi:MAG TPA: MaoC family dehydratase [Eoetvoesiella sp.]
MLVVETPQELALHAGDALGTSDWFQVTQEHISSFADLTGDNHWVHIDADRANDEMPDGKTIAHGFFILSLIPLLAKEIFKIKTRGKGLNYGLNRLRFTAPVPVGSRVRLHQTLLKAEPAKTGTLFTFENKFEIENTERPALVTDMMLLILD